MSMFDPIGSAHEGGRVRSFGYTGIGQLQWASDLGGNKWTIVFDAANGALLSVKSPSGATLSFSYDALDNVKTVTYPDAGVLTNFYDAANRVNGVGLPSGLRVTNAFDAAGRLQTRQILSGGTPVDTAAFSHNANDTVITVSNIAGLTLNGLDAAGRLVSITYPTTASAGFQRDLLNRITTITNKAASGGTAYLTRYAYDAVGNVTNSVRPGLNAKLGYNAADQLTQVVLTNGSTTNFAYTVDGAGRRVKATANGAAERRFLVAPTVGDDLESPHLVADGSNNLKAGYVFLDGRPIVRYNASGGANNVYYLEDGMGSIIGLVNTNQASVAVFTYDGFGRTRSATGSQAAPPAGAGGDFRFHGLWLEADTGLYHARARDYDPRTGRFLSRDPVAGDIREAESFNPYAFARENPYVYSDPSGQFELTELLSVQGIQRTLTTLKTAAINDARVEARGARSAHERGPRHPTAARVPGGLSAATRRGGAHASSWVSTANEVAVRSSLPRRPE